MGKNKKELTWDQLIEIIKANYPKVTPEKIRKSKSTKKIS